MQLITKSGSFFPVHSLRAAAAIPGLTTVAMLAQDFRYMNQEWSNWQCQNERRNELRFPRMKLSYPRGVQLSHPRKFECRPSINFLVTKHRTPHTCWCGPTSPLVENHPSCSRAGHTGRASSTCHLPAELLLCLSLTLVCFAFSFSYHGISILIHSNEF